MARHPKSAPCRLPFSWDGLMLVTSWEGFSVWSPLAGTEVLVAGSWLTGLEGVSARAPVFSFSSACNGRPRPSASWLGDNQEQGVCAIS